MQVPDAFFSKEAFSKISNDGSIGTSIFALRFLPNIASSEK